MPEGLEPVGPPLIDLEPASALAAAEPSRRPWLARLVLGASLLLIALNLRVLFASLSSLLPEIMRGTGAGPAAASLMTTLPVLCLGIFSLPVARLAARFGAERVVLAALLAIAGRQPHFGASPTLPTLLGGGILAGAGIAFGNVLLPGLVKRDFPDRIAPMTGLYSMALSGGAALAAGLTVPIARATGSWAIGLAGWALPALGVAALWTPQVVMAHTVEAAGRPHPRRTRSGATGLPGR